MRLAEDEMEKNGNGGISGWINRNWRVGVVLVLVVSGFTNLKSDVSYIASSVSEIKVFVREMQEQSLVYRLGEAEKKIKALEEEMQALQQTPKQPTKK